MADKPRVSVEELLPAMIELASIQHDLLASLAHPARTSTGTQGFSRGPDPVGIDTAAMILRSRALLTWLLSKTAGS